MERWARSVAAVVLAALALAAAASAGPRLVVGVDDDWLKWTVTHDRIVAAYHDLNLGGIRVTLRWQPGQPTLDTLSRLYLRRVVTNTPGTVRIVLAVYE